MYFTSQPPDSFIISYYLLFCQYNFTKFIKNFLLFFAKTFFINYIFFMKMLKINENQEELNCGDVVFYEESGWQGDGLYCVQIAGTELVSRLFLTATGFAFATANLMPLTTVTILGKIKGVLIPTISLGGRGINKACFFKSFLVTIFMLIFLIIGELTNDTSSRKLSNSC